MQMAIKSSPSPEQLLARTVFQTLLLLLISLSSVAVVVVEQTLVVVELVVEFLIELTLQ
jgi:hypothetical protein